MGKPRFSCRGFLCAMSALLQSILSVGAKPRRNINSRSSAGQSQRRLVRPGTSPTSCQTGMCRATSAHWDCYLIRPNAKGIARQDDWSITSMVWIAVGASLGCFHLLISNLPSEDDNRWFGYVIAGVLGALCYGIPLWVLARLLRTGTVSRKSQRASSTQLDGRV
jgi:hypothetical protein